MCAQPRRRTQRATPWPQFRGRISPELCSVLSRWGTKSPKLVIWIGKKRADALGKKEGQGHEGGYKGLVEDQKHWHPDSDFTSIGRMQRTYRGRSVKWNMFLIWAIMDRCVGLALLNKVNMAQVTLITPHAQSIVTANKSMHIMGAVMVQIKA